MIPILKQWQGWSQSRRLYEQARQDAYPRSWVKLCRHLVGQGDLARAAEAAGEGLARFPHSRDLRDILRHANRLALGEEIEGLWAKARDGREPDDFRILVETYLSCEEYDEALKAAEELMRLRPERPEGSALVGKILLRRFYEDRVASDARRGIVALQDALERDDGDVESHLELARIYRFIGAVSKALFHLYRALDGDPENNEALELQEHLIDLPLEEEEEAQLLRAIEESECYVPPHEAEQECRKISDEEKGSLIRDLGRLSQLNSVVRAAFVSHHLTLIAEGGETRTLNDPDEDPLCGIARGFRKAADISAKRMGIGAFQSSVLTAGEFVLQFHALGPTVVLVESSDRSMVDVIREECFNFVAARLRVEEEPVHA